MTWPAATESAPSSSRTRSSPVPSPATERSIAVGGVDRVAGTVFEGIDYAALGHLRAAVARVLPGPVARYSGSPLRYSFSEQDQVKAVLLVDLPAEGLPEVTPSRSASRGRWRPCAARSTTCSTTRP